MLELAKKLGRDTNNVAEYYALLAALDYAVAHGLKALRIRSDSELLVRQMQGRYKVKSADLKPLHERAVKSSRQLEYFVIEHVPREMNRDADALANLALDSPSGSGLQKDARPEAGAKAQSARDRYSSRDFDAAPPPSSTAIRARFKGGVFVPLESVGLVDGSEVTLIVRKSKS